MINTVNQRYRLQKLFEHYDREFDLQQLTQLDQLIHNLQPDLAQWSEPHRFSYQAAQIHKNSRSAWLFEQLNTVFDRANQQHWGMDLWGFDSIQYCQLTPGHYHAAHTEMIYRSTSEQRKLVALINVTHTEQHQGGLCRIELNGQYENLLAARGRITMWPSWCNFEIQPVTEGVCGYLKIHLQGPKFK